MSGFTYDAGALIAADRGDRAMWVLHRQILLSGTRPVVPSTVLAQAWRGGPQAQLSRFLHGCRVDAFSEADARLAGKGLARSQTSDVVDASVVVAASHRNDTVVTSDPLDLSRIAEALGVDVGVHAI
jgi:predicted nucleic acid-binding protein